MEAKWKRPDFDRMLLKAKGNGDFQVIVCDDPDRFSRAEVMDVFSDLFENRDKSLNCIASEFNRRNIPGIRGGLWFRSSVSKLLDQWAYRGEFVHGQKRAGQFGRWTIPVKWLNATASRDDRTSIVTTRSR